MTKKWEFGAPFAPGSKKSPIYIYIFFSENKVLDFEEGYFYPQEIIFF